MYKTKQIALISGAQGFIGYHLTKALQEREITPIAIPRLELYELNRLISFIDKWKPMYIFALHGYGNHSIQKEEDKIIMANYFATWNLLKASSFVDYKAFINIATSSMYGHSLKPMAETDELKPDTFYSSSKAAAAFLARSYAKQYNKPVVTAVPFSVYGEGEADFRFIPTVCKYLVTGETMPFVSYPTHDWIYVKDFVNGLFTIIDNLEQVKGEMVNIGTSQMHTNLQIVETLEEISGKTLKTEETYKEALSNSSYWVANNERLKGLGWKQDTSLTEGLKKCWEYYKMKYA